MSLGLLEHREEMVLLGHLDRPDSRDLEAHRVWWGREALLVYPAVWDSLARQGRPEALGPQDHKVQQVLLVQLGPWAQWVN